MTDTLKFTFVGSKFESNGGITGTNMTIDYDGQLTAPLTSGNTFGTTFTTSGTHTITITGDSISSLNTAFKENITLTSITIPSGVTNLGESIFKNCVALESIKLPNVTSIDSYCFQGCTNLKSITIPSSVTNLPPYCFDNCSNLISITIPSSVTSIGTYCFRNCTSLKNIKLPNVTSLNAYCFKGCTGLKNITIPSSVRGFGSYCFNNCTGLTNIIFIRPTPPTVSNTNIWTNLPTSCKIYVPKGSLSAYTSASNYPSSSTYTYIERDMIEMEKAQVIAQEIFNKLYPVGSIYMSVTDDHPADLFGGAWEQIKDKFLLASHSSYPLGSTGGSKDDIVVSHTHTVDGGSHTHSTQYDIWNAGSGSSNGHEVEWQDRGPTQINIVNADGGHTHNVSTEGVSGTDKNMPPYLVVYIWRRLA